MSYEKDHHECYPCLPETKMTTEAIKKVIAEEANKLLPLVFYKEDYEHYTTTNRGPLNIKLWKRQKKGSIKKFLVECCFDDVGVLPSTIEPRNWHEMFPGYEFGTIYSQDFQYPVVTEDCIVRYFVHDELESALDNFVITDETDTQILAILWHVD